jgi:hypothetical protein
LPTVFASVSVTLLLLYLATLILAYQGLLPTGGHMLWGLFMTILMVLLQCLIFGFFIGSGKTIKRVVAEAGLGGDWVQRTKDYKNECYPPLMLAIVVTASAGIVGGGISLGIVPRWLHEVLVWAALALNARAFWVSYRVLSKNVAAIHEINDLIRSRKARVPAKKAPAPTRAPLAKVPSPAYYNLYFLAAATWVPYLYMKFSLGSRAFPFWPFLVGSLLLWFLGWRASRRNASRG